MFFLPASGFHGGEGICLADPPLVRTRETQLRSPLRFEKPDFRGEVPEEEEESAWEDFADLIRLQASCFFGETPGLITPWLMNSVPGFSGDGSLLEGNPPPMNSLGFIGGQHRLPGPKAESCEVSKLQARRPKRKESPGLTDLEALVLGMGALNFYVRSKSIC